MTDIPSVDELISNSINEKKLKRKKKVIKVLSTLVFLFLLGFTIFFYITSDYSKLSKIRVYGNENIKEEYIAIIHLYINTYFLGGKNVKGESKIKLWVTANACVSFGSE